MINRYWGNMVDILIKNGIVLTMDKDSKVYKDGAIDIEGNKIMDIGDTNELEKKFASFFS